ncbi:MAG: CDP-alcohol phosphatidyltransferase family protein [Dysgonamonadaceae bacterium]|jgi:hypothetical protein|nr:CDP-alcohol phosphatidyltransferase family protein [Dysgonamonadaceae bacterium]
MSLQNNNEFLNSLKSTETEEFIDIWFYRPIGYRWALAAKKLHITPNQITVLSIIIGVAAAYCFCFNDLWKNIAGVLLLVWANTYDSADGQLARMTNQKSEMGRILDGAGGFIWFIAIYIAIILRSWLEWSWLGFVVALVSGYCHGTQTAIADYYRNAWLFYKKGKAGSESDNSADLKKRYRLISFHKRPIIKIFETFYIIYTVSQERLTPNFQKLKADLRDKYESDIPKSFADAFCTLTKPLLVYTNLLTFNFRSLVLFACILTNHPIYYFFFELTVMNLMLIYLIFRHERSCRALLQIQ